MRWVPRRIQLALAVGVAAVAALVAVAPAAAAQSCPFTAAPLSDLERIAEGQPVAGKLVGADWDAVVLGTVTEVRHKSPKFRYRITMRVDSTLGAELPPLYTFFGSSRGTFPFETGKVYAVPLARRTGKGSLSPTTELWVETCDPVVAVADLAEAHDIIARTKPGYVPSATPTPTPTRSPTPSRTESAVAPLSSPTRARPTPTLDTSASKLNLPDERSFAKGAALALGSLVAFAVLIGVVAVAESRWSRRRLARHSQ